MYYICINFNKLFIIVIMNKYFYTRAREREKERECTRVACILRISIRTCT